MNNQDLIFLCFCCKMSRFVNINFALKSSQKQGSEQNPESHLPKHNQYECLSQSSYKKPILLHFLASGFYFKMVIKRRRAAQSKSAQSNIIGLYKSANLNVFKQVIYQAHLTRIPTG